MIPALYGAFFCSGCSALIFKALWFRQAGLAFGKSVWASSLVLAGFMAGMAAGNGLAVRLGDRIRRPLRLYAFAEIAVALSGVALGLRASSYCLAGQPDRARALVVEHRSDVTTSPFWTWLDGLCQVLPPS